jgi:3',5'-cyclic AMP phosphodiesterase CpdA
MSELMKRRDFLRLAGLTGAVVVTGCRGAETAAAPPPREFWFAQLSDTHVGFTGPPSPEADALLPRAIAAIRAIETPPAFVVFTGDLTHTTDDPRERRARMTRFHEALRPLGAIPLRFLPGEHDATQDEGEAFREYFGATHWSFDREGVHFVALDNVSLGAALGKEQLAWLEQDLARVPREAPVIVFAHRPLFELEKKWDWDTTDGARAIELLSARENVTVFYGHIHQEHSHATGRIAHHSARSLVFPLPAPGSVPEKKPLPWDKSATDHGVGWRSVRAGYSIAAPISRTFVT